MNDLAAPATACCTDRVLSLIIWELRLLAYIGFLLENSFMIMSNISRVHELHRLDTHRRARPTAMVTVTVVPLLLLFEDHNQIGTNTNSVIVIITLLSSFIEAS